MKRVFPFIIVLAAAVVSACTSDIVTPDNAVVQPSHTISPSTGTPVATYYAACINNGTLGTVSAIGTSTTGPACLTGLAVVLKAGGALNFCYQSGGDINSFTSGVAACKKNFVAGGFAAGTDLLGCLNKSSLTALGGTPPKCGKPATIVGLAFPPVVVPPSPCTPSLTITGPVENSAGYAVVYRREDFVIGASLGGGCTGAWTYSWTYKLGDDAAAAVPATWTGSATAALTVPKWTLEKFPTASRGYVFTAIATPPSGSGLQPVSTIVHLRVLGTLPLAKSSPSGNLAYPPVSTYYTSASTDYDNPPGAPKLIYRWEATSDQTGSITPASGIDTFQIMYNWDSSYVFVTLSLTVCPSDEPYTPGTPWTPEKMLTGCGSFSETFGIDAI